MAFDGGCRSLELSSPEAVAKAAVLNHLGERCQTPPLAIMSEFCFNRSMNRADLVVLDRQITCFEIKTHADSITRLQNQIETSRIYFDKVIAVLASKHIQNASEHLGEDVGLWEYKHDGTITILRRGRRNMRPTARLADLMTLQEIRSCLRSLGCTGAASDRPDLVQQLSSAPKNVARQAALVALSRRFKKSTDAFLSATRGRVVLPSDIKALSRFLLVRPAPACKPCSPESLEKLLSDLAVSEGNT
ncbi:sce7726 family protein [Xanthobacter autotrophicus]|uniref:sce7726 family protein n=1 Tax=Xanthobacter autotrophicus TaxID=280 RepID=UPI00372D653E